MVFYGTYVSVNRINIVNQQIISAKIPDECNNMKIAFISDLHYNSFMNKERFQKMIDKINLANPDIILFGGDLFDSPESNPVDNETREELITLLKSLQAPYGKFAVLGEEDQENQDIKDSMYNIFYYADFELLDNTNVLLHSDGIHSINLVGIDSLLGGTPDITQAMSNVDTSNFTIVLTHAPDLVSQLPLNGIDLVLSGHSHAGQISLPLFGPLVGKPGAKKYTHGSYEINTTELIVNNGLGTENFDIRIFAPPQCIMLRLTNGK